MKAPDNLKITAMDWYSAQLEMREAWEAKLSLSKQAKGLKAEIEQLELKKLRAEIEALEALVEKRYGKGSK